jgi:hypothetical protein
MEKVYLLKTGFMMALLLSTGLAAGQKQKIVRATGQAQVRMESNTTVKQVYELAEEQAKINAIENAFGTYVEQQMDMRISEGKTAYNIIGTTKVRGEWVETTDINFKDNFRTETGAYGKQEVRYVTCSIKGKARKSVAKANIEFSILNLPDPASRTLSFIAGEQIYLYFKSPVDGYLSVYIDDGNSSFRLLPDAYSTTESESCVYITSDTDYLFFTPKYNKLPQSEVEEYLMFSAKKLDYNYVYIIFSEDKFVKPLLKEEAKKGNLTLPRSLSSVKFQEWLSYNRALSAAFQDWKVKISIAQKEE